MSDYLCHGCKKVFSIDDINDANLVHIEFWDDSAGRSGDSEQKFREIYFCDGCLGKLKR